MKRKTKELIDLLPGNIHKVYFIVNRDMPVKDHHGKIRYEPGIEVNYRTGNEEGTALQFIIVTGLYKFFQLQYFKAACLKEARAVAREANEYFAKKSIETHIDEKHINAYNY